jgi:TetR/AcrR family transcriptional regulator, regulator of cefoperazone and chloramphenicol sensitivity
MNQNGKNDATRDRILDEAEALFAANGFSAVTVREITAAAGCNLAAVNYYFGSKRKLYIEVFKDRWIPRAIRVQDHFYSLIERDQNPSAITLVRALAEAFLAGPLLDEELHRHHQLMSRELSQPGEALEMVAEQVMRPFFKELGERLRPLLTEDPTSERLTLDIMCIFSMVLYFNFARAAVTQITGRDYDSVFRSQLIEQIIDFSHMGLLCRGAKEEMIE